jgi:excinuclease ABC subunit A
MQFLADVELICEECKGTRYKSGILEIRYNGLNIHEVLQLTVREAMSFFHAAPRLVHKLKVLDDVGLGTCGSANRPPRYRAAKRSASNWRPTWRSRVAPARCSFSTSRPPACTSTISPSCWPPSSA